MACFFVILFNKQSHNEGHPFLVTWIPISNLDTSSYLYFCYHFLHSIIFYLQVKNYLQEIAPDLCDRVELYDKRIPIFDEYGIEEEINNILSKRWNILLLITNKMCSSWFTLSVSFHQKISYFDASSWKLLAVKLQKYIFFWNLVESVERLICK